MSATISDITVHINETLNDRELANLEQAIRSDEGVVSVGHNENGRHFMVVLYDPEEIRGKDILGRVTEQGFHGELIGFL
ncbi:MAG: hypothetical protein KJP10_10745 [Gammaproteobacteria bacterium]|nr:hypothetical protein [Gammaproteobacteria bacterium]